MVSVIAVVGAGNMGSSLIGGLIKNGHPADGIYVSDPSEEKLRALKNQYHVHTTSDNLAAIEPADVVIMAVKPNIFSKVTTELADSIQKNKPLVISIAAGISEEKIEQCLGEGIATVRCMPNTPALIQSGATAAHANQYVNESQRKIAESILKSVGIFVWVDDEKLINVVNALSGNGPAYFYLIMEILEQVATEFGLPKDIAHTLTVQTALGSAQMAAQTNVPLTELRKNVTSKGGTTERALEVLEALEIRNVFKQALHAAKLRAEELSKL